MNYLGIDYGKKHVGLAVAFGPLAQPWGETTPNKLVAKVWEMKTRFEITELVLGIPEGKIKKEVLDLADKLRAEGFAVNLADETLSSYDAKKAVRHKSKKKRAGIEHQAAAAVILQSWLDRK